MAFSVNTNLSAMNANRYLKLNEDNFTKSVQRLSSGVRINSASDDPSGLVISERLRSQTEGLNQAIRNAQDAVSMTQTAEGALDEVTQQLRNMRNLALHAANTGVNDSSILSADQDQINKTIDSLNRIANTTSFGTKKLLNGSAGVTGSCTNSNLSFISAGENAVSGAYSVNVASLATKGVMESRSQRVNLNGAGQAYDVNSSTGMVLTTADMHAKGTITLSGNMFDGKTINVTVTTGMSLDQTASAINSALQQNGLNAVSAACNFWGTGWGMNFNFDSLDGGLCDTSKGSSNATFHLSVTDGGGAANLATILGGDSSDTYYNLGSAGLISSSTKLSRTETLIFKDGNDNSVTVRLAAGSTIDQANTLINSTLSQAKFNITASWDNADKAFKLTSNDGGSSKAVKYTVQSDNANDKTSLGFAFAAGTDVYIANGGSFSSFGTSKATGTDITGNIGGIACTGAGQCLSATSGTIVDGVKVKYAGAATGTVGSVTVTNNSLNFQIGAFSGQTTRIALNDIRATNLGYDATGLTTMTFANVASIDVTKGAAGAGAQDAIKVIDAAIAQVSSMRASLGSFQKDTLESSIRSMGVASQNLSSSESTIRDADMAEEMLNFSKANIIKNVAMSMLAQANQSSQNLLRLFQ